MPEAPHQQLLAVEVLQMFLQVVDPVLAALLNPSPLCVQGVAAEQNIIDFTYLLSFYCYSLPLKGTSLAKQTSFFDFTLNV